MRFGAEREVVVSQRGSAFVAIAQIAEALLPVARGTKYEDPLDGALKRAGLGSVTGGGSLLGAQRQVRSMDVELALRDLEGALQFARTTLLSLGAPTGSLLLFVRDGRARALDITTGKEFDHEPALDALARRLASPESEYDEERERVEAAANRTLKDFESLWGASYQYPPAEVSTYSADWVKWYDQVAHALGQMGFAFVGDVATVRTDLPVPKHLGWSRKFLAPDGITRVDAFQVATTAPKPPVQVVGFKSEFEDGRYLATSNAALKWNVPDFIDDERLPPEYSTEAIAERHTLRLAAYRTTSSPAALRLTSLAQLLAAEERERVRTRRFRQEQRVPTQGELERLGAAPEFAARVHEEMRRIKGI